MAASARNSSADPEYVGDASSGAVEGGRGDRGASWLSSRFRDDIRARDDAEERGREKRSVGEKGLGTRCEKIEGRGVGRVGGGMGVERDEGRDASS